MSSLFDQDARALYLVCHDAKLSWNEIGTVLGSSGDACRKKLERILDDVRNAVSPDGRTVALWVSADPVVAPLLPLEEGCLDPSGYRSLARTLLRAVRLRLTHRITRTSQISRGPG